MPKPVINAVPDAETPPLRAIVVAGMHRSGTSAMSRVLSLLGGVLPKHLMKPHPDNPVGFWESQSVTDLNDEVLQALDSGWDDVFSFRPRAYLSNFDRYFLGRAVDLLQEEFDGREPIVLKDPRLSVLASFWNRALREAGYEPHYVIMVRNPLEVADSLRRRDSFPREKSFLLWSSYQIAVERDTREHSRIFVSYDQLMTDWRAVRRRLEAQMQAPFPRDTSAASMEIDSFLDAGLRHHRITAEDFFSREDVPEDVKQLYRVFSAACDGAEIQADVIQAVESRLTETEALVAPLLADMRARAQKLEKDVIELNDAHAGARSQADDLAAKLEEEKAARQQESESAAAIARGLEEELQDLRGRLAAAEAARDEALHNNEAHLEHVRSLQEAQAAVSAEQARLSDELASAARAADAARRDLEEAQAALTSTEAGRKAAEADLEALKLEIGSFEAETDATIRGLEQRFNRKVELAEIEKSNLIAQLDEQRARADAQQVELEAAKRQEDHLRAVSAAAERRLVRFEERLEEVQEEFDRSLSAIELRTAEEIARLEVERDRLSAETESGRAQNEALAAEIEHLRGSLEALRGSLSWRATKPFRRTVGWVKRRFK